MNDLKNLLNSDVGELSLVIMNDEGLYMDRKYLDESDLEYYGFKFTDAQFEEFQNDLAIEAQEEMEG